MSENNINNSELTNLPRGNLAALIGVLRLAALIQTPMKGAVCEPANVPQPQLQVVMALAGEGALAGHDLVRLIGMAPMNVSRAISALRKRGWVEDVPDSGNRRRRPVQLTAEGFAVYETLGPSLIRLADELAGPLNASQVRGFIESSDKLIETLRTWIAEHESEG